MATEPSSQSGRQPAGRLMVDRGQRLLLSLTMALPGAPLMAHDNVPASKPAGAVTLVNADIYPQSGPMLAGGRLRIADGKIVAIGGDEVSVADSEVIDLAGRRVYPGLLSANSVIGLSEIGAVRATVDLTEVGGNAANIRAEVAINPDSEYIPVARANGVLLALSRPGGPAGIVGTSVLLQLEGWTIDEMQVAAPLALHVVWPQAAPGWLPAEALERAAKARTEQLESLDLAFRQAHAYAQAVAQRPPDVADLRLAAMAPFIARERPVIFHADAAPAIEQALAFAARHRVVPIISGGLEAWRVTDALRAANAAVIVGGTHLLPLRRHDPVDAAYANPARLFEAGVRFAIAIPDDGFEAHTSNLRNLPYHAATAVANGLPHAEAMRAITLYPAQILGVAGRVGSLEVDKDATLFVADGDPLEVSTQVERAWIAGREIDLSSRQTRLYEKYRQRYRNAPGSAQPPQSPTSASEAAPAGR